MKPGFATAISLAVALATNPSFSEDCIRARMGWAGIAEAAPIA